MTLSSNGILKIPKSLTIIYFEINNSILVENPLFSQKYIYYTNMGTGRHKLEVYIRTLTNICIRK